MTKTIVLAGLMLGLSAAPAYANADKEGSQSGSAATQTSATSAKPAKETLYCFDSETTGSRIPVRECKTRKQWEELGVEVPVK
ncbi:MAG: hypothetical protein ACM3YM_11695 [Sphingomonadales bacterium]